MTIPLWIEFSGAVYLIVSRGNAKQMIFLDERDRADFLGALSLVVNKNSIPVSWQYKGRVGDREFGIAAMKTFLYL